MTTTDHRAACARVLDDAGIVLTPAEREGMEIAEFGLGDFAREGLGVVVYVNNDTYCAKELVMPPGQTCPEHRHPPVGGSTGKRETFRCRRGVVHLYVEGDPTPNPAAAPPGDPAGRYTAFHEVTLRPGEQHTIEPDTLHWFQAGPDGAVVSEFSTSSRDEADVFTDPAIQRVPGTKGD